MSRKCPICKKEVTGDEASFPFCSERCKLIDLGNWASGEYKISQHLSQEELLAFKEELFINKDNEPSNN